MSALLVRIGRGTWGIQSIPVPPSESWTDLVVTTQAVNPLYIGPYSIGPQSGDTMNPSGAPQTQVSMYLANGRNNGVYFNPPDAAPVCFSSIGWDGSFSCSSSSRGLVERHSLWLPASGLERLYNQGQ